MDNCDSNCGEGCIPRKQVEVALHLMEEFHGDALRRPWSDEAHAYYHAVGAIEDALDEKLDPNASHRLMNVRRSRRAREEGYAKATLLNERYETNKSEPKTITQKIIEFFQ